jgi:circadian clock protein KaiB
VIYEQPGTIEEDQKQSVMTLIRRLPSPLKKLISELSTKERVIAGLEIVPMEWAI